MGSKQVCIPGIAYPHISRRGSRGSVGNSVNFFSGVKVRVFSKSKVVSASRIVFAGKVVSEEI
jgi:hypothetical protein